MALAANSTFTFSSYSITDTGIELKWVCAAPGSGEPNDYSIFVTDAELGGVTNLATFRTLVDAKLARKFRAANIASRLDSLIGQTRTV